MNKRELSPGAAKTVILGHKASNPIIFNRKDTMTFKTQKKDFETNINNFRQSLIQNTNNLQTLNFQSNTNLNNLHLQKKFSLLQSNFNFLRGTSANQFIFSNNNNNNNNSNQNTNQFYNNYNNNLINKNSNSIPVSNFNININNNNNNNNNNLNSNNNLFYSSSTNFSQTLNQIPMQINAPKIKKVLFRKQTLSTQKRLTSKGSVQLDSNGNKINIPKIRKRESTIDDLLYQRSLLGVNINAAKDPQSILIVNKKISKLNLKIQELLNENSKKMMKDIWGFASSDDNRRITERNSTTSRVETTNRNVIYNTNNNIINNNHNNVNNNSNSEINGNFSIINNNYNNNNNVNQESKKNSNNNLKKSNNNFISKINNTNNNTNKNSSSAKYKYFSLLRDEHLKNEDIINMDANTRQIYNRNKKNDKLSKLENQLRMNQLNKMINEKTSVNNKEDLSSPHNQVIFIRKKDLRSNVYKPCLDHKSNYEALKRKSLRHKGFKKLKSRTLSENFSKEKTKKKFEDFNLNFNKKNENENEKKNNNVGEFNVNENVNLKDVFVTNLLPVEIKNNKKENDQQQQQHRIPKSNYGDESIIKIKNIKNSTIAIFKENINEIEKENEIKNTYENKKDENLKSTENEAPLLNTVECADIEQNQSNFVKSSIMNKLNLNASKLQLVWSKGNSPEKATNAINSPVRNINLSKLIEAKQKSDNLLNEKLKLKNSKDKFVKDSKENFERKFALTNKKYNSDLNINSFNNFNNNNNDQKQQQQQLNFSKDEFDFDICKEKNLIRDKLTSKRILSAEPSSHGDKILAFYSTKYLDQNKIKERLFRDKLSHLRKVFGVAYKASKKLDNRGAVTSVEMGSLQFHKAVKKRHVLDNVKDASFVEDDCIIKKYFDKSDTYDTNSENELNEDFVDRHKETLKTCKDKKVRAHLISAFTKIEIEDRILHRNRQRYTLDEKFRSLDEKKEYKKLATQKIAIEKELTKDVFDINNYLENRHLINEIMSMDNAQPIEVLQWNAKKVKIMKDIKPNIILQFNKKKKGMVRSKQ